MQSDTFLSHTQKNVIIALLALTVGISFVPSIKSLQSARQKDMLSQAAASYRNILTSGVDKQTAQMQFRKSLGQIYSSNSRQLRLSSASADYPSLEEFSAYCGSLFDTMMQYGESREWDAFNATMNWWYMECSQVPHGNAYPFAD